MPFTPPPRRAGADAPTGLRGLVARMAEGGANSAPPPASGPAPGLPDDAALGERLTALLQREARRHGIDLSVGGEID